MKPNKNISLAFHSLSQPTLTNKHLRVPNKMRLWPCNSSLPLPPSLSHPPKSPILVIINNNNSWAKKTLIDALTGVLSFTILLSSPTSLAIHSPPFVQSPVSSDSSLNFSDSSSDSCREEEANELQQRVEVKPEAVTNRDIVEEAWEIVNESFLDTGRHRWTPDSWQVSSMCVQLYLDELSL